VFGREAPRVLEIGFGDGEALIAMARRNPDRDYLGIEVHRPGIGRLLIQADALGLWNLKVVCADAVEVLSHSVTDAAFQRVHVFFPDPWPKKRHHKRRLIQPVFAALLTRKLVLGGHLHLATDWEDYAWQMLEVLETTPQLINTAPKGEFAARPGERPLTKFERRGQRLGHGVYDLIFQRG
jgi:tRNA (guanine-N7-)-methyltransferase